MKKNHRCCYHADVRSINEAIFLTSIFDIKWQTLKTKEWQAISSKSECMLCCQYQAGLDKQSSKTTWKQYMLCTCVLMDIIMPPNFHVHACNENNLHTRDSFHSDQRDRASVFKKRNHFRLKNRRGKKVHIQLNWEKQTRREPQSVLKSINKN
jgi:hypothetical protein